MISKSKYLLGLQCPRLLWVAVNDKTRLPPVDAQTQAVFDQGSFVGNFAKKRFSGVDIPENFSQNLTMTKILLKRHETLFEAGFMVDGLYARADILKPADVGWDIIEVKSSTSLKNVNVNDISFQKFVYEKAGLEINKCYLMHINNKYVRQGDINVVELFSIVEVETVDDVKENIEAMQKMLKGSEPTIDIGLHCNNPYGCGLVDECFPETDLFELYRGGKKCFELLTYGSMKNIPEDYKLSANQQIQKKGVVHIDKEKIQDFLDLEYPLYYLDFETFSTAIPMFDGVRPYQQVPFQYSLHEQLVVGGSLNHHSFLSSGGDPRKDFMESLKSNIGTIGNIIVYNESFEKARLLECAEKFPEYKEFVDSILPRFVDLIIPFRKFWYYNPLQHGSASIKKVLPALTGNSYEGMDIGDGQTASREYLNLYHSGNNLSEDDISKVRNNLENYCCLDTEGMVWILDKLRELVN